MRNRLTGLLTGTAVAGTLLLLAGMPAGDLTAGFSRKIWQKRTILESLAPVLRTARLARPGEP